MNQPSPNSSSSPSNTPTPTARGVRRRMWLIAAIVAIVVGFGVVLYPFLPAIRYALLRPAPVLPYQSQLVNRDDISFSEFAKLPEVGNKPIPAENRMVIPSIGVDMPILEGDTQAVLDRGGIWHIPKTSNPLRGGNMVLSGHRWQYLPPSSMTLYLLDKVEDGQPVIVYWQGQEFDYRITGRDIVNPDQVEILNDTTEPKLTIFTCTPVFSTKQRLVLYGELI